MTHHFYLGVDGGATKCTVRLEDESGRLLGQETSGPANVRISVDQTWQSIYTALNKVLESNGLSLEDPNCQFHAGLGLAGCEVIEAYQDFQSRPHPFKTLVVAPDSHTACLGAHGGEDGSIIIAGTGVVGFQIQNNHTTKVGGFGFPQDDDGGGAWLGLQAVKMTLRCLDGRLPMTGLAKAVYTQFSENQNRLISWAGQANSTMFAELAPIVIKQSEVGDTMALNLLQEAALAINSIGDALHRARAHHDSVLFCSLIGSIAPFLEPYLSRELRSRLRPRKLSPEAGGVLLVRHHLAT